MREHETLVFWTWNPGICAYNAWIRHEIQENNEDLSLPCDWNIKKKWWNLARGFLVLGCSWCWETDDKKKIDQIIGKGSGVFKILSPNWLRVDREIETRTLYIHCSSVFSFFFFSFLINLKYNKSRWFSNEANVRLFNKDRVSSFSSYYNL